MIELTPEEEADRAWRYATRATVRRLLREAKSANTQGTAQFTINRMLIDAIELLIEARP